MADWSTVAIAGITALAGIGGGAVTGLFAASALTRTHKRDDATLLRDQVEALFEELDTLHEVTQRNTVPALALASGTPEGELEGYNFGRVRAMIGLYFPGLQDQLDALKEREIAAHAALRAGFDANPAAAMGQFGLEQSAMSRHSATRRGKPSRTRLGRLAHQCAPASKPVLEVGRGD